jgi:hypothetical protein
MAIADIVTALDEEIARLQQVRGLLLAVDGAVSTVVLHLSSMGQT